MAKKQVAIKSHLLIPKHAVLKDKDKKELLEKYEITSKELPKILLKDPTLTSLDVKLGDIIKITRPSETAGESIYYRVVING